MVRTASVARRLLDAEKAASVLKMAIIYIIPDDGAYGLYMSPSISSRVPLPVSTRIVAPGFTSRAAFLCRA